MARRGRKKKFKLKLNVRTETLRSTVAILLLLASAVILISFLASGYSVNNTIQNFLRMGFGYAHLVLVPILFISGLWLINTINWKIVDMRIMIGLSILLFSLSGLLHSFIGDDAYEAARDGSGGGLVGYKIVDIMSGAISIWATIPVLLAFTIIGILLTLNVDLDSIIEFAQTKSEKFEFLNKFKKKLSKDPAEEEDEDIEISSGLNLDDFKEHEEGVLVGSKIDKPSFEIIPSMAEPQSAGPMPQSDKDDTSITSLNPTLPYSDKVWETPPLDLLNDPPNTPVDRGDVKQRAKIIEETLESFGIKAKVKDVRYGPSVTQYALEAESGTKIAKIANLQYDLALALASPTGSVRIEAPIPGKSLIGIEVPNNTRVIVNFKDLLTSDPMKQTKSKLAMVLGSDVGGDPHAYEIGKMPHLLIAGATGSGKSIFIHNIMASILFRASPQDVKFILIDPKRVELVHYNGIPHLLQHVITDTDKAPSAFKWLVKEMEHRYKLLETAKVRNIEAYNQKSGFQAMPYIVLVVDELAEIMVADPAAVEKSIVRLAQLARATGIHLVLALQRPSTNVITGLIKANIPCRVAFAVASQVDSRVIIDQPGAEKLLGQGDMLFVPPDDSKPIRLQGALVTDKEISNLVNFLKSTGVEPEYKEEIIQAQPDTSTSVAAGGDGVDELYEEALETVVTEGKGSASLLQRRLSIGYSRAARILDELETHGVVGPPQGSKPRDVLIKSIPDDLDVDTY